MLKILFVNGNLHGHINPTLPVVAELVRRGEEVHYFSTEEFKDKIEAMGARFLDYGEEFKSFLKTFRPSGNHPFYTLIEFILQMDRMVIPLVLEKVQGEKYDIIIHDAMLGGGNILRSQLSIPGICSCSSYAMNKLPIPSHMLELGFHPQLDNIYRQLEEARAEWKIETLDIMDIFFKKEPLNLVFTSRIFQPRAEVFDDSFKFIGPSIADRKEAIDFPWEKLEGNTLICISMGTINNQHINFYKKCIEAFKDEEVKVVIAIGNKLDITKIEEIPSNFIIRNYIPQLEILKKSDVFISHGGLNSVSEALYYGVPVIAIPQSNDQPMVTEQLIKLGAGLGLKMEEVTSEILKESVRTLLETKSYKQNSLKIKRSFLEAGGYKVAADYILHK